MTPGSLRRIRLIAGSTLREASRQRVFGLLLLVTMAFALGARALGDFNFGASELKFTADLGLGALSFFGSLLAIAGTVQTVFAETEQRTIQMIFVRPVSRLEFVAGKLAGMQLTLGLFCLLILLALGLVLWSRASGLLPATAGLGAGGAGLSPSGLMLAVGAQWLKCGVLTAAMLLLCGITRSRLVAIGAGVMLLIIFHAQPILAGIGQHETSGRLKWIAQSVAWLFPDFQRFDLSSAVFFGRSMGPGEGLGLMLHGFVFIAGYVMLAAYSFRGRED